MYAKIFTQIYDGTLCSKGPWEALVTFQQLLILADKDGCVDMTSSAISRRTTIPQEVIDVGIAALLLADPDSRTPDEEGRRIIPLSDERKWGWRIVNYAHYRNLRDEESRREYHRKYWHTRKEKLNSTQQSQPPQPELDQGSKQKQEAVKPNGFTQAKAKAKATNTLAVDTTLGSDIERARPNAPQAHRLPSDFDLTQEWISVAQSIRPDWTPQQVADVFAIFRDHWTAKSGKDATKADWLATWRNWCRREKSFSRDGPNILTPGQRKDAVSKANIAGWLAESADTNAINGEFEHERG